MAILMASIRILAPMVLAMGALALIGEVCASLRDFSHHSYVASVSVQVTTIALFDLGIHIMSDLGRMVSTMSICGSMPSKPTPQSSASPAITSGVKEHKSNQPGHFNHFSPALERPGVPLRQSEKGASKRWHQVSVQNS